MTYAHEDPLFEVPEPDEGSGSYPGNIEPGEYTLSGLVNPLREHNPDAIQFIADMLEE